MIWFFLASGLFLGWSLGANDAANIFGTAVGTRMVRFRVAALVASAGVILGAVAGGSGTTGTLAALGAVNALPGSFTVALTAGFTVTMMSRSGLPVSTSQAIVGAIIGWNLFTGSPTGAGALTAIVGAWVLSPLLAGATAVLLYWLVRGVLRHTRIHLLALDAYTRLGLLAVGAFGAYALGANNIANVMGVFAPAAPFDALMIGGVTWLSGTEQLFLLGGLAIAVGIYTNSQRVMTTIGGQLFKLTPVLAFVVVLAHSLVLFLFSSQNLGELLRQRGLPAPPLVPVSSTQAIIGAILGIALVKGGKGIRSGMLGRVVGGWVMTPVIAGLLCFVLLFVVQNVFELPVRAPVEQRSAVVPPDSAASAVDSLPTAPLAPPRTLPESGTPSPPGSR